MAPLAQAKIFLAQKTGPSPILLEKPITDRLGANTIDCLRIPIPPLRRAEVPIEDRLELPTVRLERAHTLSWVRSSSPNGQL